MHGQALTPQLALDRLAETASDVRAAVLLRADGSVEAYAGDGAEAGAGLGARLGELTRELFERARTASRRAEGDAPQVEVATAGGAVFALRDPREDPSRARTIAVVADRLALPSLVFYDLLMTLSGIGREAA